MRRGEPPQEVRKMRFEEECASSRKRGLTQQEAALVLGVCRRTFPRLAGRCEQSGLEGLIDNRPNGGLPQSTGRGGV